jgi:hypothetical protein
MAVQTEEVKIVEEKAANRDGMIRNALIGLLLAVVIIVGGAWWFLSGRSARVAMSTPYQAVLLTNGSAYFGQLEGLGTPFPVLRDVFYVQSTQNPETKQVSNILVKRGKEWHSPDRMILNSNMIVLVEPVNPTSRVAQLISQAKNQ